MSQQGLQLSWLAFNRRECILWLWAARYLHLPPEIVYYIAKHMFYDVIVQFKAFSIWFNYLQSRTAHKVLEKAAAITLCNWPGIHGKCTCAQEIALEAMTHYGKSVVIINNAARNCAQNSCYIRYALYNDFLLRKSNSECIELEVEKTICVCKPVECHVSELEQLAFDILILFVVDDTRVDALERWKKFACVENKQLLVFGNAADSEWFSRLCKEHWYDVIQA